ncbi:MAG: Hsp20/alpha crystallin family protein [Saprospiraceae bacterium]
MNIVKVNPFAPNKTFSNLMEEIFNKSIGEIVGNDFTISNPAVNIIEKGDAFVLELAAPGLEKSDFNIQVDKSQLTISVEKEVKTEEGDGKWTRKEFNYSKFSKTFTLSDKVNPESVSAEYDNGILTVTINKKEVEKEKAPIKIDIK